MRRHSILAALCLAALCLAACGDGDDAYPSVVTEIVDGITDGGGALALLLTDEGERYTLTNPQDGLLANAVYRCLCGYVPDGDRATLYSLSGVYVLRDSTGTAARDPLPIVSAWRTPRYINLHLRPKTQGGTHYYGYITDSIVDGHAYLSLHHRQNGDPEAYSADVYASIPLDSVQASVITLQGTYDFQR